MNQTVQKENLMETMPVPRLLLQTSVPLMLSLLMNALYNFVDSVFVARVSEDALTALTLASPVQILMSALGCGIAVGLNSVVSRAMGAGNQKEVRDTVSASILMAAISWIVIAVLCILFVVPYFRWQSGGNQVITDYGTAYLRICMIFSLGMMCQWVFDRLLIASGKSMLFLATLGCAAVVNLILDPVFIFGYFGLPAMGTAGAAAATVIGQFCGAALGIILNKKRNQEIPVVFTWKIKMDCVTNILKVGIPTAIMQGIVSVMGIVMNTILLGFSTTAVAVYGACIRIQSIVTIGAHGINNGLIPIVAFNYGAKRMDRIDSCMKWAKIYGAAIMSVMFLLLELFPGQILWLFDASETMLGIGIPAIRILAVAYLLSIYSMILSSAFQAFGKANYSMYLTILRQVVLLIPLSIIASWTGNLNLVWAAFVMAELAAIPIGKYLFHNVRKMVYTDITENM